MITVETLSVGFPYKPLNGCFGYATICLIHGNKNILFDVGGYQLRSVVLGKLEEIDAVVVSHLHFDHCSNLDLFIDTDIPIYISEKELLFYDKYKDRDSDLFSYFEFIRDRLNIVIVKEEMEIEKGINIIFTFGHTEGHVSVDIDDKILLAGDAIKSYKDYLNDDSYGNAFMPREYLKMKMLLKGKYNTIYFGHDQALINGKMNKRAKLRGF